MNLTDLLKEDEGLRLFPYRDTAGKLTIGYGRNLEDRGITIVEAEFFLGNDIFDFRRTLFNRLPWTQTLNEVRQAVLINMTLNMGIGGLLTFHNTLALIQKQAYLEASRAMLQSKWATQVGSRANRLSEMMRTGQWPS